MEQQMEPLWLDDNKSQLPSDVLRHRLFSVLAVLVAGLAVGLIFYFSL